MAFNLSTADFQMPKLNIDMSKFNDIGSAISAADLEIPKFNIDMSMFDNIKLPEIKVSVPPLINASTVPEIKLPNLDNMVRMDPKTLYLSSATDYYSLPFIYKEDVIQPDPNMHKLYKLDDTEISTVQRQADGAVSRAKPMPEIHIGTESNKDAPAKSTILEEPTAAMAAKAEADLKEQIAQEARAKADGNYLTDYPLDIRIVIPDKKHSPQGTSHMGKKGPSEYAENAQHHDEDSIIKSPSVKSKPATGSFVTQTLNTSFSAKQEVPAFAHPQKNMMIPNPNS